MTAPGGTLTTPEVRRVALMGGAIALMHAGAFILLFLVAHGHARTGLATLGVGTGVLAYTLGLRHAFDADHITAIDNVTRKLMNDGQRPVGVGFFFAIGHSTVVVALGVLLSFGVRAVSSQVRDRTSGAHHYLGLIGTGISGGFLLLLALLNGLVLLDSARRMRSMRRPAPGESPPAVSQPRFVERSLLRLAGHIDASWKMYPVGVLFGLGFETATEIALLALTGTSVAAGLPLWTVLCLPLLFTAGMALVDSLDGVFMSFAYGWALAHPVRKVFYNLTLTGVSVLVALFIGGLEVAQVAGDQLRLHGAVWDYARRFNINRAGELIVVVFAVVWGGAVLVWRFGHIERRFGAASGHGAA
jgi:high-affinity nickel-transport protein